MDGDLLIKLQDLKALICDTPEYKNLLIAEKNMEESEEVMLLSYKKDMAIVRLEDDLKHFSKNSEKVLNSQKNLAECTYNLNNHPLVKEYKSRLDILNNLYNEIENELFKGIKDA